MQPIVHPAPSPLVGPQDHHRAVPVPAPRRGPVRGAVRVGHAAARHKPHRGHLRGGSAPARRCGPTGSPCPPTLVSPPYHFAPPSGPSGRIGHAPARQGLHAGTPQGARGAVFCVLCDGVDPLILQRVSHHSTLVGCGITFRWITEQPHIQSPQSTGVLCPLLQNGGWGAFALDSVPQKLCVMWGTSLHAGRIAPLTQTTQHTPTGCIGHAPARQGLLAGTQGTAQGTRDTTRGTRGTA